MQGREAAAAEQLRRDALAVEAAGASLLVLECVPSSLAEAITRSVAIPTIGIGAGSGCDGQILVLHDLLGLADEELAALEAAGVLLSRVPDGRS